MKRLLAIFALFLFTANAWGQAVEEKIYGSIQEGLADPANVRHLMVFSDKELITLPNDVLKFENLEQIELNYLYNLNFNRSMRLLTKLHHIKRIRIGGSNVTSDGSAIPEFTSLEELDIYNSNIKELPQEVSMIRTIKKISLAGNPDLNLSTAFHILAQLPVLKSLEIANSKLTVIPKEIGELKNVDNIDFSGNDLSELPNEIGKLYQLKKLNLRYNQLKNIDLKTGGLPNLIDLDLGMNRLTKFPVQPGICVNLRKLNLFGNDIEKVELSGELPNLISIDLSVNNITKFPIQLARCPNLKKLRLWVNHIKKVDLKKGDLPNLLYIDLSENEFSKFPLSPILFPNLTSIAIAQNYIKVIPKEIGEFKMLDSLDLHDNKLGRLPPQIGQLKALMFLNVMTNRLTTKGIRPIYQNKNLTSLWLDENKINSISSEIKGLTQLKRFSIDHTLIRDLPDAFASLTSMNVVRLSYLKGMNWKHSISILGQLPKLQELGMMKIGISKIPDEFEELKHLATIYLLYNKFDKDEQARIRSLVPNTRVEFEDVP